MIKMAKRWRSKYGHYAQNPFEAKTSVDPPSSTPSSEPATESQSHTTGECNKKMISTRQLVKTTTHFLSKICGNTICGHEGIRKTGNENVEKQKPVICQFLICSLNMPGAYWLIKKRAGLLRSKSSLKTSEIEYRAK